jgi:F0F1-type ATP synthase gamma subunit
MRRLNDIANERDAMSTILELTSAFEGIASMRIAQIKDQTLSSEKFFAELWRIYSQIRVDELFHFGRSQAVENIIEKELMILITSE